ncbi:hypothetical protein GAY33_01125 [Azospirillum brasilense]|uniref:KilA-N domain-containing protein n=1 Tax=Azospirillum argentinense TaxID=2970906 RepID=UPI00190DC423|nr:KilA-N domain-containing protein [Azospirillum argentinense]MBK3797856.1 hypothetical protein [Azospirillum argentinense]
MSDDILHGAPFAYNGTVIRDRGDLLHMTDMWKAAGSPNGRAPSDWQELQQAADFIAYITDTAGIPGNKLVITKTGRSGGTWAHWQIGLAYAKYLSAEFHAWCNSVVRTHMEGRPKISGADERRLEAMLKLRITAFNASTRFLGEARRNGGPEYAAQIMPSVLEMLGIRAPADIVPAPLRQGRLFGALPGWPSQPSH